MTESEVSLGDPLKVVRDELTELYESDNVHADTINRRIGEIKGAYSTTLGHLAEFWLLLAVGARLAKPLPINGHVSGIYVSKAYSIADKCTFLSDEEYEEMQKKYMDMLVTLLKKRAARPTSRVTIAKSIEYQRAADVFKREYDRTFSTPVRTS